MKSHYIRFLCLSQRTDLKKKYQLGGGGGYFVSPSTGLGRVNAVHVSGKMPSKQESITSNGGD